jgi:hypothetical protein
LLDIEPVDREAEALFEEARQRARRRRRRRTALLSAVLLLAAAATALVRGSQHDSRPARPTGPAVVAPREILAHGGAYMGVACRIPNSIACDRVGLAVWTKRPARAVRATVAGRTLTLDDPEWSSPARHGLRTMFAGFLQPAGLRRGPLAVQTEGGRDHFTGVHPVSATVRLVITFADGSQRATQLDVLLSPGWG